MDLSTNVFVKIHKTNKSITLLKKIKERKIFKKCEKFSKK